MHIPDGFLSAPVAGSSAALALTGIALAVRTVRLHLPARRIPLIGLTAAFLFAAQLINFPVAGGTSGHLVGGVLATVLLGPSAAILAMTAVLILQCFMFADGGVTALGANLFNMAIVSTGVATAVLALLRRLLGDGLRARLLAIAFASWVSTLTAATACAGQLALSGTVTWHAAFPAMAGVHMLIGIGEALITTLVIAALARTAPGLLAPPSASPARPLVLAASAYGLLIALGLALFVAPFACTSPDGLERVATRLGFGHLATAPRPAPLADYPVPGLASAPLATIIAGCIGTLAAFVLAAVFARALTRPVNVTPSTGSDA